MDRNRLVRKKLNLVLTSFVPTKDCSKVALIAIMFIYHEGRFLLLSLLNSLKMKHNSQREFSMASAGLYSLVCNLASLRYFLTLISSYFWNSALLSCRSIINFIFIVLILVIYRFHSMTQSQMKHNFSKFLNDFSDKNILTDDSAIREEHSQRIQERLFDLDSLTG